MAAAVLANRTSTWSAPKILVDSAGTSNWHVGEGPNPPSKKTWEAAGYKFDHIASEMTAVRMEKSDLILVMDRSNHRNVLSLTEDQELHGKVHFLRDFDYTIAGDREVPDQLDELVAIRCGVSRAGTVDLDERRERVPADDRPSRADTIPRKAVVGIDRGDVIELERRVGDHARERARRRVAEKAHFLEAYVAATVARDRVGVVAVFERIEDRVAADRMSGVLGGKRGELREGVRGTMPAHDVEA